MESGKSLKNSRPALDLIRRYREPPGKKRGADCSPVEFFTWAFSAYAGPYDEEPVTVAAMKEYANSQGYLEDFGEDPFHQEIHLRDVRRCKPESLKTVIRTRWERIPTEMCPL